MNSKPPPGNKQFMMRYAGLATQLLVAIGLAVFIGIKADGWMHSSPVFTCVLPLLTLIAIFYKLIKETSKPKKE